MWEYDLGLEVHILFVTVSHDSLISTQIANWGKQIFIGLGLFLGRFKRIANSKVPLNRECTLHCLLEQWAEMTAELCRMNDISVATESRWTPILFGE